MRRARRQPNRLGFAVPTQFRLSVTAYPGIGPGDVLKTLLHELTHLHVGRAAEAHAWHGPIFKRTWHGRWPRPSASPGSARATPATASTRRRSRRPSLSTGMSAQRVRRLGPMTRGPGELAGVREALLAAGDRPDLNLLDLAYGTRRQRGGQLDPHPGRRRPTRRPFLDAGADGPGAAAGRARRPRRVRRSWRRPAAASGSAGPGRAAGGFDGDRRRELRTGRRPDSARVPGQRGGLLQELFGLGRCSGTSVNAPNLSVVFTAGHCVNSGGAHGSWYRHQWIFVPAYRYGQRPFGAFPAKWLGTTRRWRKEFGETSDVGVAVVGRNARGQRLGAAVGGVGFAAGLKPHQDFEVHGYPAEAPFDGETQRVCGGTRFLGRDPQSLFSGGPLSLAVSCNVTAGASGGGWTIAGGRLNSVTAYDYPSNPTTVFGPYFGKEVARLYHRARRVR